MSVDELSSRLGEFLVPEMELPARWSEGFLSSKAGDDCPFILPNFRFVVCLFVFFTSVLRATCAQSGASQSSLAAAPGLSTVAAPNPARAGNYRVRRSQSSRSGLTGVNFSFPLAGWLALASAPGPRRCRLSPVWLPSSPHRNLQ